MGMPGRGFSGAQASSAPNQRLTQTDMAGLLQQWRWNSYPWTRRILLGWARVSVIVASCNLERIAVDTWHLPRERVKFIANGVALPVAAPAAARSTVFLARID